MFSEWEHSFVNAPRNYLNVFFEIKVLNCQFLLKIGEGHHRFGARDYPSIDLRSSRANKIPELYFRKTYTFTAIEENRSGDTKKFLHEHGNYTSGKSRMRVHQIKSATEMFADEDKHQQQV